MSRNLPCLLGRFAGYAYFLFACVLLPIPVLQAANVNLSTLPQPAPKVRRIKVDVRVLSSLSRLPRERDLYGKLIWLGGLELISSDPDFGGFSGLAFRDPERFVAIGDRGTVFSARLQFDGGHPVGVRDATLRGLPGLGAVRKNWQRDAEGLALDGNSALVCFEGDSRVIRYSLEQGDIKRVLERLPLPAAITRANRANTGLETVALAPAGSPHGGSLILVSEQPLDGRVQGWIYRRGRTKPFSFPRSETLKVTDAAFTAKGDLVVLERSFSLLGGLVVQLRRISRDDFHAGNIERTDILFRGNLSLALDNMEGIDIQSQPDGSELISLISDDNFNALQRTLLLQFLLPAEQ